MVGVFVCAFVVVLFAVQFFTKTGVFRIPGVVYYSDSLTSEERSVLESIFTKEVDLDKDVSISAENVLEAKNLPDNAFIYNIYVPVTDYYSLESGIKLDNADNAFADPYHMEVAAAHYASPTAKSSAVDSLDVVILGATEIDTNFNVNVHTDSNGYIMGGSGGHSDTAAGAKMSMIVAPLSRARLPIVVDNVLCKSTPGHTVDVLVTQRGIAVNPLRPDLAERFKAANLPVYDICQLRDMAEKLNGKPKMPARVDREVAKVIYRDGTLLDTIYNVPR